MCGGGTTMHLVLHPTQTGQRCGTHDKSDSLLSYIRYLRTVRDSIQQRYFQFGDMANPWHPNSKWCPKSKAINKFKPKLQ